MPKNTMHDLNSHIPGAAVFRFRNGYQYGRCECGWRGRKRIFKALATNDVYFHCAMTGCLLSYPLVRNVG